MTLSRNYGLYGIELSLFSFDPLLDMSIGSWEIVAIKAIAQFFGFSTVLVSLEISDTRATVGFLNCFLSVFWG